MSETCSFCLGGNTEVPPFGSLRDAEDLVRPCATCSLVAHRRCLLDWFNSLPPSKLSRNVDREQVLNFSSAWGSVLINWSSDRGGWGDVMPDLARFLVAAECPQCKLKIVFSMRRLALLTFQLVLKLLLSDLVGFLALFLAVTGAATGIFTIGAVGLTRSGYNMLEAVVPLALLRPLLKKDKFRLVPFLPIMLLRLRSSSLILCLQAKSGKGALAATLEEFFVCHYFSALGSHTFVRAVYNAVFSNGRVSFFEPLFLLGLTIPMRWAYDAFFRLTFNQMHFALTASARPRDIVNSMPEEDLARLEQVQTQMHVMRMQKKQAALPIFWARLWRLRLVAWWCKTRACWRHDYLGLFVLLLQVFTAVSTAMWPFLAADIGKLLHGVLCKLAPFDGVPSDRVLFLANLAGLAAVAVVKDAANVVFAWRKSLQLRYVDVVTEAPMDAH